MVRKHCGKRRNFSSFHSVFKKLVLQTGKNQGLFGKGLIKQYMYLVMFDFVPKYCCLLYSKRSISFVILIMTGLYHSVPYNKIAALSKFKAVADDKLIIPFPKKPWFLCVCSYKSSENTVGKGKIAHNEQFLFFPQCFLPVWQNFCHFHQIQNCCLQTVSVWNSLKSVV